MEENTFAGKRKIDKISLCLIIFGVAFFFMLFWVQCNSQVEHIGFNSEKAKAVQTEFLVSWGTNQESMVLPEMIDVKDGEKITITGTLHKEEPYFNSLMFYAQQAKVQVWLDGELLMEAGKAPKLPIKMPPCSRWYFLRLPNDFEGKELRIEIVPAFGEYAKELPEIFMGTKASFLYMILTNALLPLMIGIPIIVLGVMLLLIGVTIKERELTQQLTRLGLVAILISVWILLESQITQIFTGNVYIAVFVLFTCYYLMPAALTAFLLTFRSIKKKAFMRWLFWLSAAACVLVQLLQIFGLAYYIKMVWVVHVLIILIVGGVVVCFISSQKEEVPEDFSVYRALFILGIFALGDIVYFYTVPTGNMGRFTMAGIVVFLFYLGYAAIYRMAEFQKRRAKEDVYKELAYRDLMTGLENRTAFEEEQARMQGAEPGKVIFLMADVNNLKEINDRFGHSTGDDAIISTAQAMKHCFKEYRCFRIGGDEFCVLAEAVEPQEFEKLFVQFNEELRAIGKEKEYPFFVACGYEEAEKGKLAECMDQADKRMYQRKAEMKEQNFL